MEDKTTKIVRLRKVWCETLRSGNYKQGKGSLNCDKEFCCLGVLCDIVDSSKWGTPVNQSRNRFPYDGVRESMPPPYITDAVGLSTNDTVLLASANDRGASFSEIATLIEETPITVFE